MQCNSARKVRHRLADNKLCFCFGLVLFLLFLASTILLIIKVLELTSEEGSSYSLLFGLSVMPLVLLVVMIWMLAKLLVGRRIEVREMLNRNDF